MNFLIFNNGIIRLDGMSGSDKRVYSLVPILQRFGHQITIVVPPEGVERFRNLKVTIRIIKSPNVNRYGFFITYILRTFKACFWVLLNSKMGKDTIIYSSSDLIVDSIPSILLKMLNKSSFLISGLHLLALYPFNKRKKVDLKGIYYYYTQKFVIFLLKKYVNIVFVSNGLDKNELVKKGFNSKKVVVLYGGVDFSLIPKEKINKTYDAVWVGRLHAQKGVNDLFKVWKEVISVFPKAKLEIVGEDKGERGLKDYFLKSEYFEVLKNNIEFTGYLQGGELFRAIKKARIFLFPSYYESFAIVIAEAMACGLPVVAYDLPVYSEVWKNKIIKVSVGDINNLKQKVIMLLKDDKLYRQISSDSKIYSKNFSWNQCAAKILKSIKKLN